MNRAAGFTLIFTISLLALLWHSNKLIVNFEETRITQIVESEKQRVFRLFEDKTDTLFQEIGRLAKRTLPDQNEEYWDRDVNTYITEYKELKEIEWIDTKGIQHRSIPKLTNEELDIHNHTKQIASNKGYGVMASSSSSDDYLLIVHPTFTVKGQITGYLIAHVKISALIKSFLNTSYSVKVYEHNELIFRNKFSYDGNSSYAKQFDYSKGGLSWKIVIYPTTEIIDSLRLYIVKIFLPVGLIIISLISFLTYFLLVQTKLKKEILAKKEQTDNIIKSFPDLTFIVNQQGKVIESHNGTGNDSFNILQEFLGVNIFSLLPDGYAESFYNAIYSVINGKKLEKVQFSLAFGSEDSHYEATLTRFDFENAFMTIRDKTVDYEQQRSLEDQLSEEEVIKSLLEVASQNLTFNRKLEEVLDIIISIPWLRDDGRGGIYRVDNNFLELCVEKKLDNEVLIGCRKIPVGKYQMGQCVIEKEIVHSHKIDFDNDFVYAGIKEHGKYSIPIISNGEVVGCLMLLLFADHKKKNQELRFLRNISNALAPIFKNENLERELEKERLVALEKSRLAALGEMGGGIAHEINNPLFIVIGNISRLETQLKKPTLDMEKIFKIVKTIDETSWRMSKIVKGLREFSRDGSEDDFELISLKAVVDETLALCNEKLNSKSINFEILGKDVEFAARRIQFSQVVLNLLQNSYDAISELPGDRWIKMFTSQSNDYLIIHYVDSGSGIPSHVRDKIFQPFYTTKDTGKGTGLGLSISLGLIEGHEGSLEYLEYNGHTGFKITLPLKVKERKAG